MAPLICIVLLKKPLAFDQASVGAIFDQFPSDLSFRLNNVSDTSTTVWFSLDGIELSIVATDTPLPDSDFENALAQPGTEGLAKLVKKHRAQFAIICRTPGKDMGEVVFTAAAMQQLAAKLGNLGDSLGALWVSSGQLVNWKTFTSQAKGVAPALLSEGEVDFPSQYWVTTQLTQDGQKFGARSEGLRPFTGYELEIAPLAWTAENVAARMLGAAQYLFNEGPVLQDGQTLGVSEDERFSIKMSNDGSRLDLVLEATS